MKRSSFKPSSVSWDYYRNYIIYSSGWRGGL